jgi:predicted ATPase/DNA-binding SARP family transcriptional activator
MLTIRTLGDFSVEIEGRSLTERVDARRGLFLAYLAEKQQPQLRSEIAAMLWPGVERSPAQNNLRAFLGRLRHQTTPPFITITHRTVAVTSSTALNFDIAELRRVSKHLDDADEATLRRVVDLYSGPFLSSVSLDPYPELDEWASTIRAEAEVLAVRLLKRLLSMMLESGSDRQAAVIYGARLVELVPDDDESQGLYLQSMAANGQVAEALRQFAFYRRSLEGKREVGPSLIGLVMQLKRPEYGSRLMSSQAQRNGRSAGHRGVGPGTIAPDILFPANEHLLIGRQQEASLLSNLLSEDHRLISITGLGGAGKTFFVRSQIDLLRRRFGPRLYFVDLHKHRSQVESSTDLLLQSIGRVLDLSAQQRRLLLEQVVKRLHGTTCCLVLDSFEAIPATAPTVSALLQALPQLTIITTSRIRLQLPGEANIYMDSLPVDVGPENVRESVRESAADSTLHATWDAWTRSNSILTASDKAESGQGGTEPPEADAVRLFSQCAQRRLSTFTVNDRNREQVRRICRQVGGLPLAIELAALQMDFYSLEELAASLSRNNSLLRAESVDQPARQQSIDAILESSWQALDLPAQRVLDALCIFADGWRREAMLAIVPAPQSVYRALIDSSLLHVENAGWFSLHPLVRRYAATRLRRRYEAAEIHRQHAVYFLGLLNLGERLLEPIQVRTPETLTMLLQQQMNIAAAWRWAVTAQAWDLLEQAIISLGHYARIDPLQRETHSLLTMLFEHLPPSEERSPMQQRLAGIAACFIGIICAESNSDGTSANPWRLQAIQWLEETGSSFEAAITRTFHTLLALAGGDQNEKIGMVDPVTAPAETCDVPAVQVSACTALLHRMASAGEWGALKTMDAQNYRDANRLPIPYTAIRASLCSMSMVLDQWSEAKQRIDAYEKAARTGVDSSVALRQIAEFRSELLAQQGKLVAAVANLEPILPATVKQAPYAASAFYARFAFWQAWAGNKATALEMVQQALYLAPNSGNATTLRARTLIRVAGACIIVGESAEVKHLLMEALEIGLECSDVTTIFTALYYLALLQSARLPRPLYLHILKIGAACPALCYQDRPLARQRLSDEGIVLDKEETSELWATDLAEVKALVERVVGET